MQLRRAEPGDAAALATLYRQLVGDDGVEVWPARLAELQADPRALVLVADDGGAILGTAFMTLCPDPMYGDRPFAVIENVVVAPAARGRGVGAALLGALEAHAIAARATELTLLSSRHRAEAHAFFARLGFDGERRRGFSKLLPR